MRVVIFGMAVFSTIGAIFSPEFHQVPATLWLLVFADLLVRKLVK